MINVETLEPLQKWMQRALLFPGQVDSSSTAARLTSNSRLSAQDSLGIYQRSYYSRLLACLREQFPALCYCLGESVFNAFAKEYLLSYPSHSYTLYHLGEKFPRYLMDTRPDAHLPQAQREVWIDFMIDLAGFERLAFSMFDAPGSEGYLLTVDDRNLDDEELQLQRGLRCNSARFPVAQYYCFVRDGKEPQLPPLRSTYTALVRVNYLTRLIPLDKIQYELLTHCREHGDIRVAMEACVATKKVAMSLKELLHRWNKEGGIRQAWLRSGFFVARKIL